MTPALFDWWASARYARILVGVCKGAVKRWTPMSSTQNNGNWNPPRQPCPGDEIILKEGVVFVNRNMTAKSVVLPESGELLLEDSIELSLQESSASNEVPLSPKCTGQPRSLEFVGSAPRQWLNPLNWQLVENGVPSKYTNGLPFVERVPCISDNVTFPESGAYKLSLTVGVTIANIFLDGQVQSQSQLNTFIRSTEGRKRFSLSPSASISSTGSYCNSKQGCACGTDKLKQEICSSFVCPPACDRIVVPVGDCCTRCGSLVLLDITPQFDLDACQSILRNEIVQWSNWVMLVISRISKDQAQIVLTDNADGQRSIEAGEKIRILLDRKTHAPCGTNSTSFIPGKFKKKPDKKDDDNKELHIALGMAIPIVVLLIVLLLVLIWRKKKSSSLQFRGKGSFKNKSGTPELSHKLAGSPQPEAKNKNIYDKAKHRKNHKNSVDSMPSHINPVYSEEGA